LAPERDDYGPPPVSWPGQRWACGSLPSRRVLRSALALRRDDPVFSRLGLGRTALNPALARPSWFHPV